MRSLRLLLALPMALAALTCGHRSTAERDTVPVPARSQATAWNHAWAHGAVFYEVFVRSFQDSDGDGKGDINGLISPLDFLNDGKPEATTDLGVDALWPMPVFASPPCAGNGAMSLGRYSTSATT